jgi:2-methylcitrate dehydratase PrpD
MALGIAANLAAGLRCNNGTMAKPLVSGTTGSNAILACLLAREGMTASREAIEGRHAFFDNFSRAARTQLDAAFATPVESRDVLATGLFYKLYPCCAGSHASIDCALEIAREHLPLAEEIVEIEVEVPEGVRDLLIHSKPSTETEAKFSLEYCVAAALADSQMGAAQFVPSRVADTNLQSLMGRVKPVYLPGRSTASRLQVRMRNGQVYSSSTERARGMPGSALPWAELENKFRQCVSEILPLAVADAVLDRLRRFEDIGDVADFVAGLVQPRT